MSEIVCVSPIDGREVARRETASQSEIGAAITSARQAQAQWVRVPVKERARAIYRFVESMRDMNSEIVPELARQMGRPVRYGGEFRSMEERIRHMAEIAEEALAPLVPLHKHGFKRYISREPMGIVLTLAPWNYPFLTAANTVGPALLAGNSVILKAASQTVLTGERFQWAMDQAGLPQGVFRHLILSHEDTVRLLASGAVDHVSFTGSTESGRLIERATAGTFTSLGLELGGKDPAYVRADARIEDAVANLVDGAFYNSGQSCCGVERIYVHEHVYNRFVEGFVALVGDYVLDDPLQDATTLGPMAATRFADVVRRQTNEAIAKGGKALIDSQAFVRNRDGTPWLAPQVLTEVDHSMSVMMEESFGPVVGIMKVRGDDEAIGLMNDSPYGLTGSIWTSDENEGRAIGTRIETGTVYLNRCDYLDPALAWTGIKDSGRGVSLSQLGYEMLTRPKSFHLREV